VYFSTPYFRSGNEAAIYRWNSSSNSTEAVTKFPEFLLAGTYGVSFGLTPEGEPLMLRDMSNRDLYALDMELP
jgi:hypothetical protein